MVDLKTFDALVRRRSGPKVIAERLGCGRSTVYRLISEHGHVIKHEDGQSVTIHREVISASTGKIMRMHKAGHPPGVIANVTKLSRAHVVAVLEQEGLRDDGV